MILSPEQSTTSSLSENLARVAIRAEACRKCNIGCTRNKMVFSDGNPNAKLMIVGEGPGHDEDLSGIPFVGPAGVLLDKMLKAIGYDRSQVYIANVIRCRATEIINGRVKNRPPSRDEESNCSEFLAEQIQLVNPELILAAGAPAAKALTKNPNFAITKQRGKIYTAYTGHPVLVTFHPAYLLRLTGDDERNRKSESWTDLKLARSFLKGETIAENFYATPPPAIDVKPVHVTPQQTLF